MRNENTKQNLSHGSQQAFGHLPDIKQSYSKSKFVNKLTKILNTTKTKLDQKKKLLLSSPWIEEKQYEKHVVSTKTNNK